jgi:hypothetical protein
VDLVTPENVAKRELLSTKPTTAVFVRVIYMDAFNKSWNKEALISFYFRKS